mmetsp:Transcript_27659/g.110758  ORF Transcript_27659/g.110758 Transcript_27659/m.110758 type:complete len:225 (+) Transcript_27659:486-1160(+)
MRSSISAKPASSRQANPPACTTFEAPLKAVVMTRLKSSRTLEPSAYSRASGTTVQPSRTPVNPAYLENEFTSMATFFAPSISKIDFGTPGVLMKGAYAASKTMIEPSSVALATSASSCARVATAPVGLLGEQKYITSARGCFARSGKKSSDGSHFMYTNFSNCPVSASTNPVWPSMTEVSTYTGYDGSCTADVTAEPNINWSRAMSHFAPSLTNTSSGVMPVPP